ncbi:MAG TPA: hypothetical protein VF680_11625 [Allosphingosinicella sp.]|jgi:hypothetical protein
MDDRAKLDEMIAELTVARREEVQAFIDMRAAQRRREEAISRVRKLEHEVHLQVGHVTAPIRAMTNAADDAGHP